MFFLVVFFFFFLTCFYPTNRNNIQLFAENTSCRKMKQQVEVIESQISEHRRKPKNKHDPKATVINWQGLVTVIMKIQRLFIQKKTKNI